MSTMGYVTTLQGADDASTLDLAFNSDKYKVNGATTPFNSAVTFTRSSSGGAWDDQGKYVMQPSDIPRFDYDPVTLALRGLLVEEQRSNLLARTNSIFAWSVLAGVSTQRDGTRFVTGVQPIIKLVEQLDVNGHTAQMTGTTDILADTTYTISFFAKTAGRGINLSMSNGWAAPDFPSITVNLTNFTFTTTGGAVGKVTPLSGGFCRVSLTLTRGPTPYVGRYVFRPTNGAGEVSYLGDGISGAYIGGVQIEAGTVATSYIPSTDTFTSRSTTATYFDLNKTLKTAAINEARSLAYDWDDKGNWKPLGFLEELAATNLALQSNSSTTFAPASATYVDVGQLFVDGVSPLRKLVESNTNAAHYGVAASGVFPANQVCTTSFIVKPAGRTKVRMLVAGGNMNYDLVAMTATKQIAGNSLVGTVQRLGDGFFRITRTAAVGTTDLPGGARLYLLDDIGTDIYQGDGVSGMFAGGFQVEVGASASSYIPTTTAQVTRASDLSTSTPATRAGDIVTINNFSTWYNQSEGTVCVEATPIGVPSGMYASFDNGVANESMRLDSQATGNRLIAISQGTTQASIVSTPAPLAGANQRMVASYKANSFDLFSGGSVVSDTSGLVPTVTRLRLMNVGVTGQPNAHIKSLRYWPFKLTGQQLQIV